MNTSDRNKQVVLASAIVAKAAVKMENGKVHLIVVFQESTRYEFYWLFQAKNARSPRRSWKFVGAQVRDFTLADKPYRDFGTFAEYYARNFQRGQVLSVRVHHARRMAALLAKTNHESIHSNWEPQNVNAASFELVNKRAQSAISPKGYYFNRRDRELDEATQDPNEVLVYEDWCEECSKKHVFAHFPSGKKQCKLDFVEMRKHPGYVYRGYTPHSGFCFVSRTAAFVPQGV